MISRLSTGFNPASLFQPLMAPADRGGGGSNLPGDDPEKPPEPPAQAFKSLHAVFNTPEAMKENGPDTGEADFTVVASIRADLRKFPNLLQLVEIALSDKPQEEYETYIINNDQKLIDQLEALFREKNFDKANKELYLRSLEYISIHTNDQEQSKRSIGLILQNRTDDELISARDQKYLSFYALNKAISNYLPTDLRGEVKDTDLDLEPVDEFMRGYDITERLTSNDPKQIKDIHVTIIADHLNAIFQASQKALENGWLKKSDNPEQNFFQASIEGLEENYPLAMRIAYMAEIRRKLKEEHGLHVAYKWES